MKKHIGYILGFIFLSLTTGANAGIITNNLGILLPESGTLYVDLDGDSVNDLGLAEDCCAADNTWTDADGFGTSVSVSWLSAGDVVDASLTWTGTASYMALGGQITGTNYIAVQDTSIGNFYGYATLDYDGTDLVLTSYTYDDTGNAITVGGAAAVPEPASLALFGLGLVGLGFAKRKKSA